MFCTSCTHLGKPWTVHSKNDNYNGYYISAHTNGQYGCQIFYRSLAGKKNVNYCKKNHEILLKETTVVEQAEDVDFCLTEVEQQGMTAAVLFLCNRSPELCQALVIR